jgi:twitching motility protein PilI
MTIELQNSQQIIQLLQQMEDYSRKNAAPLPMKEDNKSLWSGVAFRIAKNKFVVPMNFVQEIMKYPSVSKVPGSKEWVRGIANVRGNLLPVFDLQGFLHQKITQIKRETRILSISTDEISAGLIVDEVYGMKRFEELNLKSQLGNDMPWKNYFQGGYQLDGENWIVFNLQQLIDSKEFLDVEKLMK